MREELKNIDFSIDQHLFAIRKDGEYMGGVEICSGKITTYGYIGEGNEFQNLLELMFELQGFGISFDDLYYG